MEQQNIQPEPKLQSMFTKATPLSKYLAMFLFITLPFIGGWVGYQYAPEKVVEVERIIEKGDTEDGSKFLDTEGTDEAVNENKTQTFSTSYYEVSFKLPANFVVNEMSDDSGIYNSDGYTALFAEGEFGESNNKSLLRYSVVRNTGKSCSMEMCFMEPEKTVNVLDQEWEYLGGSYFSDAGLSESVGHVYRKDTKNFSQYITTDISLHENLASYPEIESLLSTLKFSIKENIPQ